MSVVYWWHGNEHLARALHAEAKVERLRAAIREHRAAVLHEDGSSNEADEQLWSLLDGEA